ncbi:putative serine protease PepD [Streptomyces sp. Ag109_O5-1]|uniref:S1C family serine protease n=1 Tax=Streptomyces sp. Ag109_O5-1 TaxID=1938851 RepID=UPI000F4D7EC6|nr:trypsin-like peptidase domain-containing protein [Streptomyces sp. Ag109_O5-1]RPE42541.1 putative serine protease PepD [Streptomyces sp. Ag109_O5-1]
MSTENEDNPVPPAPSVPPVPPATPAASPQPAASDGDAPTAPIPPAPQGTPAAAAGDPYGPPPQAPAGDPYGPPPQSPEGSWPPPPPATPSYADAGAGSGTGWGSSYDQAHQAYQTNQAYQQPQGAPQKGSGRGGLIAAVLVAALVAGGLGGGLGYTLAKNNDNTGSTTVSASTDAGAAQVKRAAGTIAAVAAKSLPSTVTIEAEGTNGEGGTGTGFVFDTQGHIVTNNHVVADALGGGKLTATFPNGKKYDAEVVGHAQGYDVAVIKLKNPPSDLNPLTLGNSDNVAVGDETIAIGAPFGLSNTVTTGIISAKNRPVASSDGSSDSKASYMSALQTDASINPGNSGGPLLDASGAVIGINSAIQSASSGGLGSTGQSGSIGLGFAIPINQAKYVAQQLIKTGKPVYAKIGASVSLEDSSNGAQITDSGSGGSAPVESGGPADKAGLKPGDVITKLDDSVIDSGPTLIGEIWTHKPGDKIQITYKRGGSEHTVTLTLGSRVGDN